MPKFRRGVTFAEVLVVIVIILIGASLILTAGQAAKGSAQIAVCTSNLRQLVTAMKLYQAENEEYPPNSVLWPGFRTFYPTPLRCAASKNIAFDNLRTEDYTMLGSVVGKNSPTTQPQDAFAACRLARGSMIPIALDVNHALGVLSKANQAAVMLVARDDGSIQRLKAGLIVDRKKPCDTDWISGMYNY